MAVDGLSVVAVARLAAAAALEAPGVLGFHGGAVGELATYGQGGPIRGVRVVDRPEPRIRVHLIVRFGVRLDNLAQDVRTRVREALDTVAPEFAGGIIDIHVADLRTDAEALPAGPTEEPMGWR